MNFVNNNSSFVTPSFYPSVDEAVAFHVPATQLSESCTRMRVDCLNDHQVLLQKSIVFTAVIGLIATISALFTMVLVFPVFWRSSWLEICIAFVVLMFVGCLPFVLLQTEYSNGGDGRWCALTGQMRIASVLEITHLRSESCEQEVIMFF